jgi:hypothetical protein
MCSSTRQVLELKCTRKHLPKDVSKLPLRLYPLTLQKIWTKANKELKQIKVEFGDAEAKEACAMGAIAYYLSNKETCHLSQLMYSWQKTAFRRMVKGFESKGDCSIWELNDSLGWSFSDFAEKAFELGI